MVLLIWYAKEDETSDGASSVSGMVISSSFEDGMPPMTAAIS